MTVERSVGLGSLRTLDYTMLLCEDLAPMRAFYVDVLGLDVQLEIPDRYLELCAGAVTLALRRRGRPYDGPPRSATGASIQLAFRVPPAEVDVAAAQLIDQGITPLDPVQDLPDFGHRVLFFADPEANIIEIYAEI